MSYDNFLLIPMSDIHVDEDFNCRKKITPIDVVDLAKDIKKNGLLQPVIVAIQEEEKQQETGRKYRLIAGFRRYKAHLVNKETEILASIHPGGILTEKEARYLNLSENLHRQDLNILQEAWAILSLYQVGATQEEAMARLGKSRGWIQIRFMLLELPAEVQKEVAAGYITQPQIRQLHKLNKKGTKEELHEAVKKLKEAKERGEKSQISAPKSERAKVKRHRGKQEIFNMQDHIREAIGNNFGTRCLGWAGGVVSDGDLIKEIQAEAMRMGKIYRRPEWAQE